MSYFRSVGDAITDPSQVDPSLPPKDSVIVGNDVGVKRVPCDQLPADSLARQPGQVCGPPAQGITDWLLSLIRPGYTTTAPAPADTGMSDTTKLLLAGGAAAALYYLYRKKRS